MQGFIVRMVVTALGLALAAWLIPGIAMSGPGTLILAALLMGIVNGIVRPVVILLTLPLTVVTLGLFLLVVNVGMLGLVAWLLEGFTISGFFAGLLGWIIISAFSGFASWFIGSTGRYEVIITEKRAP